MIQKSPGKNGEVKQFRAGQKAPADERSTSAATLLQDHLEKKALKVFRPGPKAFTHSIKFAKPPGEEQDRV